MYDRSKLIKLAEECVTDAKNVTIYRELQTEIIRCLFNARLEEAKEEIPEQITELGNPEVIETVPNTTTAEKLAELKTQQKQALTELISPKETPVEQAERPLTQQELRDSAGETPNVES